MCTIYMYTYIHIYTYIHTYIHAYTQTYICIYINFTPPCAHRPRSVANAPVSSRSPFGAGFRHSSAVSRAIACYASPADCFRATACARPFRTFLFARVSPQTCAAPRKFGCKRRAAPRWPTGGISAVGLRRWADSAHTRPRFGYICIYLYIYMCVCVCHPAERRMRNSTL